MNQEIKTPINGVVIAQIVEKTQKTRKEGKPFWILKLKIRRSLTRMYFQLTGKKEFTLHNGDEPMFVFTERGRFVKTLLEKNDYFFEFRKTERNDKDYFHAEEWNKLGNDKKTIERAWRLLVNKGDEIKEETEKEKNHMTNQQLLEELQWRIKQKEIFIERDKESFKMPNSPASIEREFVTDLVDKEGKVRVDLQEEE